MSRAFAGPSSNETISFSAGASPGSQGPFTMAALVKANAGFGWIASGNAGSTPIWSAGLDTSAWFMWNDFTSGRAQIVTTGHWAWIVVTKATGSAIPRWHIRDVTSAGSWDHTNTTGGTVADNAATLTSVTVGNAVSFAAANCWQGSIAALATWNNTFTDLQVEGLATLSAADLLSGGGVTAPKWMVRLNQASTATSVPDDTGNGGNQSAITGTSIDVDEPPGWSYTLTAAAPVGRQLVMAQAVNRSNTY
jgi:hypothetical protein